MRSSLALLFLITLVAGAIVLVREQPPLLPEPIAEAIEEYLEPAALPEAPETSKPVAAETEASLVALEPGPLAVTEPPPPASPAPVIVEYTEEYIELLERSIHDRINTERVRAGLGVLAYDDALAEVAAGHSTDMAKDNYFAHEDDDGCDSACRVTDAEYPWRLVGENLFLLRSSYRYSAEEASAIIVAGWMGSEGHRRNVLEGRFTHEGMGVVVLGNSLYATQVLTRPR